MMQALSDGSGGMSLLQLQSTKPLRSYTKLQGSTTTTISSACGSPVKQATSTATTSTLTPATDDTQPTVAAAPSRVMPPPAPSPRLGPAALHVPRRRSTLPRFPPSRFLSDVLHGSTVTSVVCGACGHASRSEQRFSSLSVELDDLNQFADAGTIEEVERAAYQWKLQQKQERKRKAELRKRKQDEEQAAQDAASNPRMEVDEEQAARADNEFRDASESELGDTDDEEHLIHTRVQQALQHLDRARGGSRACHLIDCLRT